MQYVNDVPGHEVRLHVYNKVWCCSVSPNVVGMSDFRAEQHRIHIKLY